MSESDITRPSTETVIPRRQPVLPIISIAICLALAAATQYAAQAWEYYPILGAPVFTFPPAFQKSLETISLVGIVTCIGIVIINRHWWRLAMGLSCVCVIAYGISIGPIYSPLQIIGWVRDYGDIVEAQEILQKAGIFGVITLGLSLIIGLTLTRPGRRNNSSISHGSARWGDGEALRNSEGLFLGELNERHLRYKGDGHLVTVAPTRSGKGVSVIIPNLLSYPGSIVVTDPKGENYSATARRRQELGADVHALDPFEMVGGTATCNPLDVIHAGSPDIIDDTRLLADMLVTSESKETGEQAFWNEEARALLTGIILYVVAHESPERRTLSHVRSLLTLPPGLWTEFLNRMSTSNAINGMVARSAARILQKAEKERSGVISSAQAHTHFLDSPRMARILQESSINLSDISTRSMSLFLILPPDRLETYHRWLRLMITTQLVSILRSNNQVKAQRDWPIVFFLDEFAHLGRLQPVARDMALIGGYGVTFWLFLQNLSQLRALYGDQWTTFLANADVLQAFGTNDWETVEYLSKMTGETTIRSTSDNASRGHSRGKHGSSQEGRGVTRAERGRRLLLPDEVRRLDTTKQLLFCNASDPILASKIKYYNHPLYAGQFDPNPLHCGN